MSNIVASSFSFCAKKIAIPHQAIGLAIDAHVLTQFIAFGGQKSSLKIFQLTDVEERIVIPGEVNGTWSSIELNGHSGDVCFVSWNSENTSLLSIDVTSKCHLWTCSEGNWSFTAVELGNPGKSQLKAKWSPHGNHFLLWNGEGTYTVFSSVGQKLWELQSPEHRWIDASWSTDSRVLLMATESELHVLDAAGHFQRQLSLSTALTSPAPAPKIKFCSWSMSKIPRAPNASMVSKGNLAVVFSDGRLQISAGLDAHNRDIVSTRLTDIVDVQWSSDENSLAILGYEKHRGIDKYKIMVYDVDSKGIVNTTDIPGNSATSLTWLLSDSYLAVTVDAFMFFVRIVRTNLWTMCDNSLIFYNRHGSRPTVVFWNMDLCQQKTISCRSAVVSIVAYNHICAIEEGDSQSIGLYYSSGECIRKVGLSPDSQFFGLTDTSLLCGSHHMMQVIPYPNPLLGSGGQTPSSASSSAIDLIPIIESQYSFNHDAYFATVTTSSSSSSTSNSPCIITAIAVSPAFTVVFCHQGYFIQFSTDEWYPQAIFHFGTPMGIILRASFNNAYNLLAVLSDTGEFDLLDLFHHNPKPIATGKTTAAVENLPSRARQGGHSAHVANTSNAKTTTNSVHSTTNSTTMKSTVGTLDHGLGGNIGYRYLVHRKDVWNFCWARDDPALIAVQEKEEVLFLRGDNGDKIAGHICHNVAVDFHWLRVRVVQLDKVVFENSLSLLQQQGQGQHILDDIPFPSLHEVLQMLARKEYPTAVNYARENAHVALYHEIAQAALQDGRYDVAREIFLNRLQDMEKVHFVDRLFTLSTTEATAAVEAFVRSWINALRGNALATQFFDMILQEDIAGLRQFLSENPSFSVSQLDQSGKSALHIAAQRNLLTAVRWLCSLNIFVDQSDKHGNTAFACAAAVGHLEILQFLLRQDGRTDPNHRNKMSYTALFQAIDGGHLPVIDYLVKEVPSSVTFHVKGESALTYATRTGRLPVLEYLSQFLHVDDEDGNGKTCLFVAAEMDQLDVAKYLVEEKNVNVYHVNKHGMTARGLVAPPLGTTSTNRVYEYLTALQRQGHDLENLQRSQEKVASMQKSLGNAGMSLSSAASAMHPSMQELVMNPDALRNIMAQGKRPWGRSKIMLVGEGRAGKTALANSILGRGFHETDSTVGINQVTCDVQYTVVTDRRNGHSAAGAAGAGGAAGTTRKSLIHSIDGGSGGSGGANHGDVATSWVEYKPPVKELEAAVAKMVVDKTQQRSPTGAGARHHVNNGSGGNSTNNNIPDWVLSMMTVAPPDASSICEDLLVSPRHPRPGTTHAMFTSSASRRISASALNTSTSAPTLRHPSYDLTTPTGGGHDLTSPLSVDGRSPSIDFTAASQQQQSLGKKQVSSLRNGTTPMNGNGGGSPGNRFFRTPSDDPNGDHPFNTATSTTTATTATTAASVLPEYDPELVLECLADKLNIESKFVLSLFDFGGQSIFNVIHPFFLTKFGVYVLVFNMEWLADAHDANEKERCLAYMRFWLNSIIVHTQQEEDGSVAPIALVGTRKDLIHQPAMHETISNMLYAEFGESAAWSQLIENTHADGSNGKIDLFFFPIDNHQGRKDPTLKKLLTLLEQKIDEQPYVHAEQPLAWLHVYDLMKGSGKPYLLMGEVEQLIETAGMHRTTTRYFLAFMHEMGLLMWHADDGLADVIILDPVAYFVTPATILICKHEPNANDPIHHSLDVHKKAKKHYKADWDMMVKRGVISSALLSVLLSHYRDHEAHIVGLMVKYGLLLPMETPPGEGNNTHNSAESAGVGGGGGGSSKDPAAAAAAGAGASTTSWATKKPLTAGNNNSSSHHHGLPANVSYLAPSLLPDKSLMAAFHESVQMNHSEVMTFYFVFYASRQLEQLFTIPLEDCRRKGFLPTGFFERLICKAISWSQQTTGAEATQHLSAQYMYHFLSRSEAILYYGNQRFRMRLRSGENMIEVNVEGQSPVGVHSRLREQIASVIAECMKTLRFFTLLPLHMGEDEDDDSSTDVLSSTKTTTMPSSKQPRPSGGGGGVGEDRRMTHRASVYNLRPNTLLLPLSKVQLAMERKSVLNVHVYNRSLDTNALMYHFGGWLDAYKIYDAYDVFISYRQGRHDSALARQLFDLLSLYTLAEEDHRAVAVFLDEKRLETGRSFQEEFAKALVRATVIVPIISADALKRMVHHDASREDNVLVEWMLTLFALRTSSPAAAAVAVGEAATTASTGAAGAAATSSATAARSTASSVKSKPPPPTTKPTSSSTSSTSIKQPLPATIAEDGDESNPSGACAALDRRKSRVRKVLPLFVGERNHPAHATSTASSTTNGSTTTATATSATTAAAAAVSSATVSSASTSSTASAPATLTMVTTVGDLFAEGWIEQLPEIVPTTSIQLAHRLFHQYVLPHDEHAPTLAETFGTRTVRDIVRELTTTLGLKLSDFPPSSMAKKTAVHVYHNVQECVLARLQHLKQHPHGKSHPQHPHQHPSSTTTAHRNAVVAHGSTTDLNAASSSPHRRSVFAVGHQGSTKGSSSAEEAALLAMSQQHHRHPNRNGDDGGDDNDDGLDTAVVPKGLDDIAVGAATSVVTSTTKPLAALSVEEIVSLFRAINLLPYLDIVRENGVDGLMLDQCEDDEELRELGITKSLHVKKLRHFLQSWKLEGVPRAYLPVNSSATTAAATAESAATTAAETDQAAS